ncbi:hypothetical protein BGZ49_004570 [Haplosporangium sp. Z 27]|nr:hypothetical protein BGZ49_004570 [Haplosporangium sp. Z 27]
MNYIDSRVLSARELLDVYLENAEQNGKELNCIDFFEASDAPSNFAGAMSATWRAFMDKQEKDVKALLYSQYHSLSIERKRYWRRKEEKEEQEQILSQYARDVNREVSKDKSKGLKPHTAEYQGLVDNRLKNIVLSDPVEWIPPSSSTSGFTRSVPYDSMPKSKRKKGSAAKTPLDHPIILQFQFIVFDGHFSVSSFATNVYFDFKIDGVATAPAHQNVIAISPLSSSSSQRVHDHGRNSSISQEEDISSYQFRIDPEIFINFRYHISETDVGKFFLDYQRISARTVNNLEVSVTTQNIGKFLSMNYIWDLSVIPKNLPKEIHKTIIQKYTPCHHALDDKEMTLCNQLDMQLMKGCDIFPETSTDWSSRSIIILYEILSRKLPQDYLSFENGIEDTYCHGIVDALLTHQFPTKSNYKLDCANGSADGSRERRKFGYKPDGIISRCGRQLAFLEVKPPKDDKCVKFYLEDLWKLSNLCKDAINLNLQQGLEIRRSAAVQIFGHRMALYSMEYEYGVYHWSQVCTAHLPCDQQDTRRVAGCLGLLRSLESFLNDIDADPPPRTPEKADVEEFVLGRDSNISPTKRPMF